MHGLQYAFNWRFLCVTLEQLSLPVALRAGICNKMLGLKSRHFRVSRSASACTHAAAHRNITYMYTRGGPQPVRCTPDDSTSSAQASSSAPAFLGRRAAMLSAAVAAASSSQSFSLPAAAIPLAPLGRVKAVGGEKRTGLSAEEVAAVLERDLREGQYFVTGDLTREIFADDCRCVGEPASCAASIARQ